MLTRPQVYWAADVAKAPLITACRPAWVPQLIGFLVHVPG
jgi:hypothetical protein